MSEILSTIGMQIFRLSSLSVSSLNSSIMFDGFTGFLRYDELSNLLCLDIKFYLDYCLLLIELSKTDQHRDGAWVAISRSTLITCPSRALKRYVYLGEIDFDSDLPLFRGINAPNAKSESKLSFSRVRELVKEAFKDSIDSSLIGVHSLRA